MRDSEPGLLRRCHTRLHANPATALVTRVVVTVLGVGVILAGALMLVAPGPGLLAIALGLGILATEYHWAERWVHAARRRVHDASARARAMDPVVRRRRLLAAGLVTVLVVGGVTSYLVVFDWPGWATAGWDQVQDLGALVPELPGM